MIFTIAPNLEDRVGLSLHQVGFKVEKAEISEYLDKVFEATFNKKSNTPDITYHLTLYYASEGFSWLCIKAHGFSELEVKEGREESKLLDHIKTCT